jgi:2-polyprenyl-3-methyl-5-hydroxy-6-metoxy-1,4-benzoquinol methylase
MSFNATNSDFEFKALALAHNYRREIACRFRPYLKGSVLEIGCGIGQFTSELARLPQIEKLCGLEPDARFREGFLAANPRIELIQGLASEGTAGQNALVSVNVLEHIEEDEKELTTYRSLLKPGGHLCLFVPARRELFSSMDTALGHYRRYVKPELAGKLHAAGFRIKELCYFNPIGYLAWLVTFRLLKQRKFSPRSVAIFDRFLLPISLCLGRLIRNPIGQNLIAIAQV